MRAATLPVTFCTGAAGFFALAVVCASSAQAPPARPARLIGTVSTAKASVSNPDSLVPVANGVVTLAGSSVVTAREHTADITLARGGTIAVCRSSVLHVTAAAAAGGPSPLLLAIDKGALEVQMQSTAGDVLLTPDLRLTTPSGGPLDLALDVTASGDTCINNRGPGAPVISITDAFGEATYQVKPDQHILFEHGDLHAVVDRESTPCGCPPDEKPAVSIAEALLSSHGQMTPEESRAAHPFPAAVSSGLADPTPVPAETPDTHVQVATTLTYDPSTPPPPADAAAAPEAAAAKPAPPKRGKAEAKKGAAPAPAAPKISKPVTDQPAPQIATLTPAAPPSMAALQPTAAPQVKRSSVARPFRAIGRFLKRVFID